MKRRFGSRAACLGPSSDNEGIRGWAVISFEKSDGKVAWRINLQRMPAVKLWL